MRTSAASINCTQCGAGLDVLGGGRVRAHVCSYCGAQLDAQDGYKVIAQFRDMDRPASPFSLGMEGELWGVPFTVIGTIEWVEYHSGRSWRWVDHQVFSPTHGYAWLTVEDGFVTAAIKSRSASKPPFLSDATIENAEHRPSVTHDDRSYRYYSSGVAKPTFIEGEFNYLPSLDETVRYVSLVGGDAMLDIVETGNEREYELSYLPDQAALFTSFGVPASNRPSPRGVHPLQTVTRTPLQLFARNLFLGAAAVALFLGLFLSSLGSTIAQTGTDPARWNLEVPLLGSLGPGSVGRTLELPFEVTAGRGLTEITIQADVYNSWAWFEAELTDAEGESVAEFERGVEYYRGSDWSEGSTQGRTRLRLEPGQYTLTLAMTEAEVDWRGGRKAREFSATVRQGVASTGWLWTVAGLFGLLGGAFLGQRFWHNSRRMAGSDWSDD